MNFFKKIGEIGGCLMKKSCFFMKDTFVSRLQKYSTEGFQLLLDKAGELIYLHKIFQHLSAGVAGNGPHAENLPAMKPHGQSVLNQSTIQ